MDSNNVPLHKKMNSEAFIGEDVDPTSYSSRPIEGFGEAALRGLGWTEDKAICRNPKKAPPKIVEYVANYDRSGLGVRKKAPHDIKKRKTDGPIEGEDGRVHHMVSIDKEEVKKVEKHSRVKIRSGKYEDMKGIVLEYSEGKNEATVELELNDKKVTVAYDSLKLYTKNKKSHQQLEEDKKNEKLRYLQEFGDEIDYNYPQDNGKDQPKKKDRRKKELKWVLRGIVVKVISKKYKEGRLYEKKLNIQDVIDAETFTATDDRGQLYEDLREKEIQTVMPKANGLVKILVGEHKGKIGTMLERNKKKNLVQVQLHETMDIEQYTQDDCCMTYEQE